MLVLVLVMLVWMMDAVFVEDCGCF